MCWNGFGETWLRGTGVAWNDPRVNLLYADLTGLPPINVYYGDHELFVGEAIAFANRAKDAGVDVSLFSVPAGQHNFILGAGRVPEVDEAVEKMGRWLRSKLWRGATECLGPVLCNKGVQQDIDIRIQQWTASRQRRLTESELT
jgi:acetyl esterase/lipase